VNGDQFIRATRKWARVHGFTVEILSRGKGSHRMLKLSNGGLTTVKHGEIPKGLKAAMMRQAKIPPDAF